LFTGIDYVFLSNIEPSIVEIELSKIFRSLWQNPKIDMCEREHNRLELFISKDEKMDLHHEENGFALDENNEGCVFFGARLFPFLQGDLNVISWNQPEKLRDIAPYKTNISLHNVWEYTLVLPAEIEESAFCNSIYNNFLEILKIS